MGGRGGRIFQETGKASDLPVFEDDRKIIQPTQNNKRTLSDVGLKEYLSKTTLAVIELHESFHFLDHKEQLVIVSPEGRIIERDTGRQFSVAFNGENAKGNIVSHNHPNALPIFSPQDIANFVKLNMLEHRVTSLSGEVVRIWQKKDNKADLMAFVREYTRVFKESENFAMQRHKNREIRGQVSNNDRYEGMTIYYLNNFPDFQNDHLNYIEQHMDFEKFGINYARIRRFN